MAFSKSGANLTSLQEFFSLLSSLRMPIYQRQYSWEVREIEDLWNDLFFLEANRRYFFGTILLKRTGEEIIRGPGSGEIFEIIDGQQRLATVMILIRSILDELKIVESEQPVKIPEVEFVQKAYFKSGEGCKLKLQGSDDIVFQSILNGGEGFTAHTASQKRLQISRNFFVERLHVQKKKLDNEDAYTAFLKQLLDKVLLLEIMKHVVETDEDAVVIFQTVNDRGVMLSSLDKTKSFLMHYLYLCSGPEAENNLKLVSGMFASIFADIEQADNRVRGQLKTQKDFEREIQRIHFILFKAGATYFAETFASLKEIFFSMYRKDDRNPKACADYVMEYATSLAVAFSSIKKMLLYSTEDEITFGLDRVFALNYSTYLPLLLSGWMVLEKNHSKLVSLLKAIECLEFRYSSFRARRSYTLTERINARALDLYHGNQDLSSVLSSLSYLTKHYASDGTFRADLESENFYFGSKSAMKLLFYEYEIHLCVLQNLPLDISLDRWMSPEYQIDHIWAQAALSAGNDFQEYLECGNKLGNLTVVPAQTNAAMYNMNFSHKRIWYKESTFESLKLIADGTTWRRGEINRRTSEICNFALKRWAIPRYNVVERIRQ